MPGAKRLADSKELGKILKAQAEAGRMYAAICAAPGVVLQPAGLLEGRTATAHPSFVDRLADQRCETCTGCKQVTATACLRCSVPECTSAQRPCPFRLDLSGALKRKAAFLRAKYVAEANLRTFWNAALCNT